MPHQIPSVSSQVTFQSNIFQPARTNAVYFPNYRVQDGQTPANLNFNCINVVYYAFANVNGDGSVTLSDENVDLRMTVDGASGCIQSLMNLKKRYYYLRVILSIGGANGSRNFASVASNAATRDKFATTARSLVDQLGFDGIDIDWEVPENTQQGCDFLALLAAIRTKLPPFQYYVSAALPAGEWALRNIDMYQSQCYLDMLNLMAYDFAGSWTTRSGHQSQLFSKTSDENSGDKAIHYLLSKGFPASKILLGIPAYGRSFLGAAGPGQPYNGMGGSDGAFTYKDLPRPNTQEVTDRQVVSAYCIGGDGGFVSYDNPDSVKFKANYCNTFGLAGLFYWEATQDAATGPRSLIYTGFNALNSTWTNK